MNKPKSERPTKRASSRTRPKAATLPLIGWREWLGLPLLNVLAIKAKIDTGARTSAIHAFRLQTFTDRGSPHISFVLHTAQRRRRPTIECIAEIHDKRLVRSSTGHQEMRYVIKTPVIAGKHRWMIELTLADRDQMGFRMLLGREAIRRRFHVDPGRSFLFGKTPGENQPLKP